MRFYQIAPKKAELAHLGIFSICAFAPCGGFGGSVSFLVSCAGEPNRTVTAAFEYPFRLNRAAFAPSLRGLCNGSVWTSDVHLVGDFSSGAQFFVAVAVLAFLYSLAALGLYVAFLPLYRGGRRLPMAVSDLQGDATTTTTSSSSLAFRAKFGVFGGFDGFWGFFKLIFIAWVDPALVPPPPIGPFWVSVDHRWLVRPGWACSGCPGQGQGQDLG
uniref:Uncharacterized protein n=1 Tax=Nothoprocta perdicaria TaxID=30464 RepID=A0A8C6Z0C2_NOTPE